MSVTTISPAGLAQRCKTGQSCDLIDVRTPLEFRETHVEFARNVPLDQLDPDVDHESPQRQLGRTALRRLPTRRPQPKGVRRVPQEGIYQRRQRRRRHPSLRAAGLPLVRGKKAISLERQVRIVAGSLR